MPPLPVEDVIQVVAPDAVAARAADDVFDVAQCAEDARADVSRELAEQAHPDAGEVTGIVDRVGAGAAVDAARHARAVVQDEPIRTCMPLQVFDRREPDDRSAGRPRVEVARVEAEDVPVAAGGDVGPGENVTSAPPVDIDIDAGHIADDERIDVAGALEHNVDEVRRCIVMERDAVERDDRLAEKVLYLEDVTAEVVAAGLMAHIHDQLVGPGNRGVDPAGRGGDPCPGCAVPKFTEVAPVASVEKPLSQCVTPAMRPSRKAGPPESPKSAMLSPGLAGTMSALTPRSPNPIVPSSKSVPRMEWNVFVVSKRLAPMRFRPSRYRGRRRSSPCRSCRSRQRQTPGRFHRCGDRNGPAPAGAISGRRMIARSTDSEPQSGLTVIARCNIRGARST